MDSQSNYEDIIKENYQVLNMIFADDPDGEGRIIENLEGLQYYRFVRDPRILLLPGRFMRYIDIRDEEKPLKNAGFIVRYEPKRGGDSKVVVTLRNIYYRLRTQFLAMFVKMTEEEIEEIEESQ